MKGKTGHWIACSNMQTLTATTLCTWPVARSQIKIGRRCWRTRVLKHLILLWRNNWNPEIMITWHRFKRCCWMTRTRPSEFKGCRSYLIQIGLTRRHSMALKRVWSMGSSRELSSTIKIQNPRARSSSTKVNSSMPSAMSARPIKTWKHLSSYPSS